MRYALVTLIGLLGLVCPAAAVAADPPKFEFKDGDRVVLLGDTFIERDQKYGYLETLITIANPDKNITFRNLGWSGDTVRGTARAFFGTEADGFKHLKEHVLALKPTVIILGYGMADSFDGKEGLPRFVSGLNTLLEALAPANARLVFLSPIALQDLGRPLPAPERQNQILELYVDAIAAAAAEHKATFIDLFEPTSAWSGKNRRERPLSDDEMHLTELGYWRAAPAVAAHLGAGEPRWSVELERGKSATAAHGCRVQKVEETSRGVRCEVTDETLPEPRAPLGAGERAFDRPSRILHVGGLAPGRFALKVDGRITTTATDGEWRKGVRLDAGPEDAQVEQLRKVINEKNRLYFYRWRPQNETYLFGFRKHEQGNNAREIPLFDPLVEAKEKEIARLKKPVPHTYELVRHSEEAK